MLTEMFRRQMSGAFSEGEKQRLGRQAAEEAASHVLEFLPEKIDRAVEQLGSEAVLLLLKGRSVVRAMGMPPLAGAVEQLVRAEGEAIKARLGIHPGPTSFLPW